MNGHSGDAETEGVYSCHDRDKRVRFLLVYMEKRNGMVQLKIKNESELYNHYDPLKERISEEVYHYLKSYCTELQSEKHSLDVIRIITDEPIDGDHFKKCVQNAARRDLEEFDSQIARNKRLAFWEYTMGILLSIAGVALSLILDQVLLALISFFGSMAIGDAVTISAKINPDIRRLKKLLDPLFSFDLEVIESDVFSRKQ